MEAAFIRVKSEWKVLYVVNIKEYCPPSAGSGGTEMVKTKPFSIQIQWMYDAYQKVASNGRSGEGWSKFNGVRQGL